VARIDRIHGVFSAQAPGFEIARVLLATTYGVQIRVFEPNEIVQTLCHVLYSLTCRRSIMVRAPNLAGSIRSIHVFFLRVPRLSRSVEKTAIIAALVLAENDTLWPFEKVSPLCA